MATWMPGPIRGCLADTPPVPPSISRGTWTILPGRGCLAPPVPQVVFFDTFTQPDNEPLENHTPDIGVGWKESHDDGHVVIRGNKFESEAGTVVSEWVTEQHNADCTIEATCVLHDNNNGAAITFRGLVSADRRDRYQFGCADTFAYYYKRLNDVNVVFNTNSATGSNVGQQRALRVELEGTNVQMFVDDVLMFDLTDETELQVGRFHGAKVFGGAPPWGSVDDFKITAVE